MRGHAVKPATGTVRSARPLRPVLAPVPSGRHRYDQGAGGPVPAVRPPRGRRSRRLLPRLRQPPRRETAGRVGGVNRRRRADPGPVALVTGPTTRSRRGRHAAVGNASRGGRAARPGLISRLVDRRPYRRRQPGIRLRRLRPARPGHIPRERENDPYQHRADGGGEPRATAGAEEPSRSRPSMHGIYPWHGSGAYHHGGSRPTRVTGR